MNKLDEVLAAQSEGIEQGKIIALESLLDAIKLHGFDTVSLITGHINNKLDSLKGEE